MPAHQGRCGNFLAPLFELRGLDLLYLEAGFRVPDVLIATRVRRGCHERLPAGRAHFHELLLAVCVFEVPGSEARGPEPPVRVRPLLTAASECRGQEPAGKLHRFLGVEVNVYEPPRRLAGQDAHVLAVGPVAVYLVSANPQTLPPVAAWVLLASGDRYHGHATANEGGCGAAAFLRAHAAPSSGVQSPRATSTAAAISASGARPSQ